MGHPTHASSRRESGPVTEKSSKLRVSTGSGDGVASAPTHVGVVAPAMHLNSLSRHFRAEGVNISTRHLFGQASQEASVT